MPMMPNTSVRPLATRNSSSPYCTPFSSWIRKVPKSIKVGPAASSAAGPRVRPSAGQDGILHIEAGG